MKEIFNRSTRNFSTVEKTFSDWDQIRDLVNDQLPKGIKKVEKVSGSETDKSYKIRVIYETGYTKEIEVPITGRDALGNYNRATRSKVENTARHEVSEKNKEKYSAIIEGWNKKQLELVKKSHSRDYISRMHVAFDSMTPKIVLERLSNDKKDDVRRGVTENPNCPKEILEKLSKDKNELVRSSAARNPNCPKEILERSSNDNDWNVRYGVAKNPNCPKEILEKLSNDEGLWVRSSVAENPNCPKEILEKLSKDKEDDVRRGVASNYNCPKEILEKLSKDKNDYVSGISIRRLKSLND